MSTRGPIGSIPEFVRSLEADYAGWETEQQPWFRGEPGDVEDPLLPTVYREDHDENALLQFFRMRAPSVLNLPNLPQRGEIDLWLFIARHVGLPTRLLDWSEGALVALWFAIQEEDPVVWMLNPVKLNRKTAADAVPNAPTITWASPGGEETVNAAFANIQAAWSLGEGGLPLPVAVSPTHIHGLMSAQRSVFTVHGRQRQGLGNLVGEDCLLRYDIEMDPSDTLRELRRLGISRSSVFPDPRGLAKGLADRY